MKSPIQFLLSRCETGFFPWQKVALTALGAAYVLSPLDMLPDILFPIGFGDDVAVILLLVRVWRSPTLPKLDGGEPALAPAPCQRSAPFPNARVPVVRREKIGGVS